MKLAGALGRFFGRNYDRKIERPHGISSWLGDRPDFISSLSLSLQHLSIQSVYFLVPAAAIAAIANNPAEVTRFLCLSILAAAIWQGLQVWTSGWVGSGYPIPAVQSTVMVSAYIIAGDAHVGFNGLAALILLTGFFALILTFALNRIRIILPNEISGVVVILVGVGTVSLAAKLLGLTTADQPVDAHALIVVFLCLTIISVISLSRTRVAKLSVLLGALLSIVPAILLGEGVPHVGKLLASAPWLALPDPWIPSFSHVPLGTCFVFLLIILPLKANLLGSMLAMQRASDLSWTRPDPIPLRRGLLANGIGIMIAGLIGGAVPGPGNAALGISIATGTMARRIVWFGIPLLVIIALCPKLVTLFVLVPKPIEAAVLFYVSGFLMAQGAAAVTARLLDTRRTLVVALGLSAGVLVASAPLAFQGYLSAIASPTAFGAVVAFAVNLLTLPTVAKRSEITLALNNAAGTAANEWFANLAAAWGLKARTSLYASHSLDEIIGLLIMRSVDEVKLGARWVEDRVEIQLSWTGDPLPRGERRPRVADLIGTAEAQEGFAVWMATREAQSFTQTKSGSVCSARLVFED